MSLRKQTCLQCRRRKVRCDGELSGCANCTRLRFSCSFSSEQMQTPEPVAHVQESASRLVRYTVGGTERRRGLRACQRCRSHKARCSGEMPQCRRCAEQGFQCQYLSGRRTSRPVHDESTTTSSSEVRQSSTPALSYDAIWERPVLEAHINAFFEHVYPIPRFHFIHQGLFRRSFHHNQLDPLLLRCVCGVATRFMHVGQPDGVFEYARGWLQQAESQVWSRLHEMNVQNLQALLLLAYWHWIEDNTAVTWTLSAMATRIAYGIRLNHAEGISRGGSFVLQETGRRVMWSIFMLDKYHAGGFPELTLCAPETMHIQLPCEETSFELEIPVTTGVLNPNEPSPELERGIGLMGHMARIMAVRHAILQKTRQIISAQTNPYDERDHLHRLETTLDEFAARLPDHLRLSSRNLLLRAYSPRLTGYLMLHSSWHQCYCDLYRMMIPGIRESVQDNIMQQAPVDYAQSCRKICLDHAIAACNLWSELLQQEDQLKITDNTIASYVYQGAQIMANLWNLEDGQEKQLRGHFQVMIRVLDYPALIYPVVANIQQEIQLLMTELDGVIEAHRSQTVELPPHLTLTMCWRTILRQRAVHGNKVTSKFGLLSTLWDQANSSSSPTDHGSAEAVTPSLASWTDGVVQSDTPAEMTGHASLDSTNDLWLSVTGIEPDYGKLEPFHQVFDTWSF